MKLYGADVCPFVHRVRLGLGLKGLQADYVAIDLANKPDWYHDVLPSGKVPLLEHDGNRIWESVIILEYLDDAFPARPLYPQDPGQKARTRLAIEWVTNELVGPFYALLGGQEEDRARLNQALEQLQDQYLQAEFFNGDRPGALDVAIYPWFERMVVLEHYRDFVLEDGPLKEWASRMASLDVARETANPDQYYIDLYTRYAREKATA
ncbi:MAG: glutathione S-transferase family protein [Candidatus Eremiobacteraeota bacterium]|nr:glutathione S-transferase family protein [Candidatus Eremiobacteraeota bacterium]